jgi:hypothetical protein
VECALNCSEAQAADRVSYTVLELLVVKADSETEMQALSIAPTAVLEGEYTSSQPLPDPPPAGPLTPLFTNRPWVEKLVVGETERYRISSHLTELPIRIQGANFVQGATVSFSDERIAVPRVRYLSSTELEAVVTTNTGEFALGTLVVSNPDGFSDNQGITLRVARLYDLGQAGDDAVVGYERMAIAAKTVDNLIGYDEVAGILSYGEGTAGTVEADGHMSGKAVTKMIAALPAGAYQVELRLGHPTSPVGPLKVVIAGRTVAENLTIPAGQSQTVVGTGAPVDGLLAVELRNADGAVWASSGVEVYAVDGDGFAAVRSVDSDWVVGQATTLAFTFKASEFDLGGGSVRITVPDALPAPQANDPAGTGYVAVDSPTGVEVGPVSVTGRTITVPAAQWQKGRVFWVTYGDRSQGGPGIAVDAAANYNFAVATCGRDGGLKPIIGSPDLYCRAPEEVANPWFDGDAVLEDEDSSRPAPEDPGVPERTNTTTPDESKGRVLLRGPAAALAGMSTLRAISRGPEGTSLGEVSLDMIAGGSPDVRVSSKTLVLHAGGELSAEAAGHFRALGEEPLCGQAGGQIEVKTADDPEVATEKGTGGIELRVADSQMVLNDYWHDGDGKVEAILRSPKYSMKADTALRVEAPVKLAANELARFEQAATKAEALKDYLMEVSVDFPRKPKKTDAPDGGTIKLICEWQEARLEGEGDDRLVRFVATKLVSTADSPRQANKDLTAGAFIEWGHMEPFVTVRCIRKSGNNDGLPTGTAMFSPRSGCYFNCAKSRKQNPEIYFAAIQDGLKGKAGEYVAPMHEDFKFECLAANGKTKLWPTEGEAWFVGEDPATRLFDQADLCVVLAAEGGNVSDSFVVENEEFRGCSFVTPPAWRVGGYKAKWVVVGVCNVFGDPDGAKSGAGKPRKPEYATKQDLAKSLRRGAHVVLGFASRFLSDPNGPPKNAEKLKAFGAAMMPREGVQDAITKAWLDSMELKDEQGSGWYQYVDPRTEMKWWRQIPVAFGGNIRYKIGGVETTNYEEKLPVGDVQPVGPGFRIEPNKGAEQVFVDYREYGPAKPPQE